MPCSTPCATWASRIWTCPLRPAVSGKPFSPPRPENWGERVMYAFTFERPSTAADAAKLAASGAKFLAGGQTLLASMKLRLSNPATLADLGGIKELAGIRKDGNKLVIGAMARHADVAESD